MVVTEETAVSMESRPGGFNSFLNTNYLKKTMALISVWKFGWIDWLTVSVVDMMLLLLWFAIR